MDVISYILSKRYIDNTLAGAGALQGKSAYDIAVENGFVGTEEEWLNSLVGSSPIIGENGHWIINNIDTGVIASPDLSGYYSELNLIPISEEEILDICK